MGKARPVLVLALAASCSTGLSNDDQSNDGESLPVVLCDPPADCWNCPDREDGPCWLSEACACECVWAAGQLPRPWWLQAPPSKCLERPVHDPMHAYDDCPSNPSGATPEQCGAPPVGVVACVSNAFSGVGRATRHCLTASDCPEGMLCALDGVPMDVDPEVSFSGICEKACSGTGGQAECVRCDMECNSELGVCQPRAPDLGLPVACEADCQCDNVCVNGYCSVDFLWRRVGLCGPDGDCPCNGGACEGECCVLPGGGIAGPADAACQP